MPQVPGDDGAQGVVGDRPPPRPRHYRRRDAGSLRQRPGPRVRRSLHDGVLAATSGKVGALSQRQRRGGLSDPVV